MDARQNEMQENKNNEAWNIRASGTWWTMTTCPNVFSLLFNIISWLENFQSVKNKNPEQLNLAKQYTYKQSPVHYTSSEHTLQHIYLQM